MKEERLEILKMVSEGKINVEEAERLIEALEGSETVEEEEALVGRGPRRTRRRARRHFNVTLNGVTDFLKSVGSDVATAISDAVGTLADSSPLERGFEEVELDEGSFDIGPHDKLVTWPRLAAKGANIIVKRAEGSQARVQCEGTVQVWRRKAKVVVQWDGEDLILELPTVGELTLRTPGGNVEGQVPESEELNVKSLGGDIRLSNVATPFWIKTMGGNIELVDLKATDAKGVAKSMGGNIDLAFAPECSARILATTVGGNIDLDEELGTADKTKGMVKSKVTLRVGAGDAKIKAETVGGDIALRRSV